jgi:Predicted transcriptional regulators
MRRGLLPYCVLAMLRDTERYGFELVQALGSVDGMVTGQGTIYPLLPGCAGRAWSAPRGGNPPRGRRGATTSSPRPAGRRWPASPATGPSSGTA